MGHKPANPDQVIAVIAARQHGVVALEQLLNAGLSRDAVYKRAQRERLHRLHRGVYAVGHRAPSFRAHCTAAVLACGSGAALSHRSAAELWGLLRREGGPIHVSVPTTSGRKRRRGIDLHRCGSLAAADVTGRLGIRVTTPARTIADLRGSVPDSHRRRAIRQAEVMGLNTGLASVAGTRSELEDRFLRLCARHRIPHPEVNVRVGGWEVDFLWRDERVVVETDGYQFHRGASAFERDHTRDLDLRAARLTVLHFTYRQVTGESAHVVASVRRELKQAWRLSGQMGHKPAKGS